MAMVMTGCVSTLDGRKEAGNPMVKDKLVRVYERPVMQCWAATKDVLTVNGTVFSEDVMQSTISARVDTRTVRVKVEAIDPKMTRVTVQTRTKMGNSDLDLGGDPPRGMFRPSVDVLFESVARAARAGARGVLLSGLGNDGVGGLLSVRQGGGATIVQRPETCVVPGMPLAAREVGAAEDELTPDAIAAAIVAGGTG